MRIIQNRPRTYTCEGVTLQPGPNEVSAEAAKAFLAHKAVKNLIKIGHITVEDKAAPAAMPKGGK